MEITIKCNCGISETKIFKDDDDEFFMENFELEGSHGEGAFASIKCSKCKNHVWSN